MATKVVATAFGGPEVLSVVEADVPEPGPGEVVIAVKAAGVNLFDHKVISGVMGADPDRLPLPVGLGGRRGGDRRRAGRRRARRSDRRRRRGGGAARWTADTPRASSPPRAWSCRSRRHSTGRSPDRSSGRRYCRARAADRGSEGRRDPARARRRGRRRPDRGAARCAGRGPGDRDGRRVEPRPAAQLRRDPGDLRPRTGRSGARARAGRGRRGDRHRRHGRGRRHLAASWSPTTAASCRSPLSGAPTAGSC